jgi:hypothetical protein
VLGAATACRSGGCVMVTHSKLCWMCDLDLQPIVILG